MSSLIRRTINQVRPLLRASNFRQTRRNFHNSNRICKRIGKFRYLSTIYTKNYYLRFNSYNRRYFSDNNNNSTDSDFQTQWKSPDVSAVKEQIEKV